MIDYQELKPQNGIRSKRRVTRVRDVIKDSMKLHHDNAPIHMDFIVIVYLVRSKSPSPLIFPTCVPVTFFCFLARRKSSKKNIRSPWKTFTLMI